MKSWDERFVDEVRGRIIEDIQSAYDTFGQGRWMIRNDVSATGMAAVMLQAKVESLNTALKHLAQTHDAMTGKAEKKTKEAA